MLSLLAAAGLVLLASGLCSGSEAALFSVPNIKVKHLVARKVAGARALLSIREDMNRPIATIVILNNMANIVGSMAVGNMAVNVLGNRWLGMISGLLTFLVIVYSEIIPKTVGERHAERIALLVARPLLWVVRLMTPLLWLIEKIIRPFTRGQGQLTTNEAEIKLLAKIGHEEGVIEQDESEMIQRVFKLNDLLARDVMTPRVTTTFMRRTERLDDAKDAILACPHSRIVVVGETVDEVEGIVYKNELLAGLIQGERDKTIGDFVRPVQFVPAAEQADRLLVRFRQTRQHLAVVLDEFGGLAGVVTLEDVLEVITGQIVDETDQTADLKALARKWRAKRFAGKPPRD